MKIWLDDDPERDPGSDWVVARTADEAVVLLSAGDVEAISLDHDLGDFRHEPYPREVTGMDVVRWMFSNRIFPKLINIHSFNFGGTERMASMLCDAGHTPLRWRYEPGVARKLTDVLRTIL